jgi:hypothetical protein
MKGKTLLSLAIVLGLVISAMPIVAVKANPANTMEIVFENGLHTITKNPGDNFVVTLKIALDPGVVITQWISEITWDPAVLSLKTGTNADLHEGNFMKAFGTTVWLTKPVAVGHIPEMSVGFLAGGPASGSGDAATMDFHALAVGTTTLLQVRAYLLNGLNLVACSTINGTVDIPPPPATAPNAEFTPADGTFVNVGSTVMLVGSASTPGYDTLPPPGTPCPITDYKWDVDLGNDGSIDFTLHGETASFDCTAPGLVGITLTVTATDPNPPSAPDYVDHNSEKHVIMQVTPPIGPAIDVYTDRGGVGPGMLPDGTLNPYPIGWSDAYGPQEEVTVYAKVTYNDEPVEYKPVAFEMVDPTGQGRDFRTAFTDANGIATTSFRIPWQGSDAEDMFGTWVISASVSVSEVEVQDKVPFRFGYIVSIRGINVSGSPLHKLETMTIDVDLKSISMASHDVLVTIVACDECNVPIGLADTFFTVDPEDGMLLGQTITIPKWAYVGTGTIYVNVFTNWPWSGGVPYCPERNAVFIILKTP